MENEYLAPLPRNQHRSTHGIMKVFQRKLRKSQFHQTILRLLCQISERFVVLFVLHQILQIRIGKCAKEAIAIGSRLSYWLVFRCQIFQFRNIDDIVGVLAIQHRNILQFANKRNCITNLWCGSRLKKEDKNWIVNICHCVYSSTHTDCIRAAAVPITLYTTSFSYLHTSFSIWRCCWIINSSRFTSGSDGFASIVLPGQFASNRFECENSLWFSLYNFSRKQLYSGFGLQLDDDDTTIFAKFAYKEKKQSGSAVASGAQLSLSVEMASEIESRLTFGQRIGNLHINCIPRSKSMGTNWENDADQIFQSLKIVLVA